MKKCKYCRRLFPPKKKNRKNEYCSRLCANRGLASKKKGATYEELYGKKKSDKLKTNMTGNNYALKKNAGYKAIHLWIRKHKPRPKFCEECGKNKPQEVANISGEYKRDINDYKWWCSKCHRHLDGTVDNLLKYRNKNISRDKKGRFKKGDKNDK